MLGRREGRGGRVERKRVRKGRERWWKWKLLVRFRPRGLVPRGIAEHSVKILHFKINHSRLGTKRNTCTFTRLFTPTHASELPFTQHVARRCLLSPSGFAEATSRCHGGDSWLLRVTEEKEKASVHQHFKKPMNTHRDTTRLYYSSHDPMTWREHLQPGFFEVTRGYMGGLWTSSSHWKNLSIVAKHVQLNHLNMHMKTS